MSNKDEKSMVLDSKRLVEAVANVLPTDGRQVVLHEPHFGGAEWQYVKECLDTGWVSSVGKFVDRFENMLSEYTGVRRAVAVVNGTAALHVCLVLAGVERQDEVLMPDMTFVATANAVTYCGAIPHFADIARNTLGMDPEKLDGYLRKAAVLRSGECINKNTGRRIKAIVPMHTFGHPVQLEELAAVCDKYKLQLVEDAAESLGSYYKGRHTGNWGLCSALSFNGNKVITTGGGGAILTNDEALGRKAKHITTTAKVPHPWEFYHDMSGYNYRLPNINAALGCAQMEQLDGFIRKKRELAAQYQAALQNIDGIECVKEPEFARSNYWLNALILSQAAKEQRNEILTALQTAGIGARPAWRLMHTLPMFTHCPKMDTTTAESLEACLINLPSSVGLTTDG